MSIQQSLRSPPVREFYVCSCIPYLRESFMITGLVVAVIGVVESFFSGQMLFLLGFALLGVVTLFGAYYVSEYASLQSLNQSVTVLTATNRDLQATRDRLEGAAHQLRQENEALRTTNTRLSEQVTQLQAASLKITEQVHSFTQENLQLRNSLDGLEQRNVALDQSTGALCDRLGDHAQQLEKELVLSKSLCQEMFAHLTMQKTTLAKLLHDLNNQNGIPEKIKALTDLQREINTASDKLKQVQIEFAASQSLLTSENEKLQTVRKDLENTNSQLAANVSSLSHTRKAIDNSVSQLKNHTDSLYHNPPPHPARSG